MALVRWRLDLAYDGAGFHGLAAQPGVETVAGVLAAAIARSCRLATEPEITVAGRTDAGVHALAQVVHVDLPATGDDDAEARRLTRSVNGQLAGRVVVTQARVVTDDFSARFSATWRAYRYLVVVGPGELTLARRIAWCLDEPLDADRLSAAGAALIGRHDFRALCRRPPGVSADEPLVREVLSATWSEVDDPLGLAVAGSRWWRFDVAATAFCHQMVRSMVALCVAVAQGTRPPSAVVDALAATSREGLPAPAPAEGLCLVGVGYGAPDGGPSGSGSLEGPSWRPR